MQQSILTKIKLFILRNRQNRIFRKFVQVLCCMVVFVTTYALILPAITMEQDAFCGKEAHEHTEECLQPVPVPVLVCTQESLGIHTHSGSCYNADGAVICGQADYVVHSHSGSCYDAAGQLVCLLPERSSHVHGESCYIPGETQPEILHVHSEACYIQEQGELTCTEEEREGHSHDDQCYGPGELLECSLTENHVHDASCYSLPLTCSLSTEPHVHSDACYGTGNLQCTTPEYHTHTDSCWDRTLSCGKSEGGHQHSGSCWETVQVCQNTEETHEHGEGCTESRLICGLTEESHYHGESCYTANLRCQIPENHAHSSSCYESILVCGKEAGQAHEHNDSCYGTEPQLQCRMPENHVHDSGCYNRILNCEVPEDPGHWHEDACYQWNSVLNCGLEEGQPEPTEPPEPVLACTEPEAPVHVHGDSCFELQEKTCQGGEDHQHTDSCYNCGLEAHAHTLICYSDPDADVESPEVWKATFAHVTLTGDWPTDVVAIAETQLGYTESTRNYDVWEDNSIHGYTRYGAWYGVPHGDWCGMFASFCLNYAEVKGMPHNYGVRPWIEDLTKLGLYYTAKETTAQKGNLIFFDWDADGLSDHVGIVAEVQEPQEHTGASVKTIEGNSGNAVRYQHYDPNDPVILGYGLLPGQERIPLKVEEPQEGEFQVNTDINLGPVVILTAEAIASEEGTEEGAMMFALAPRSTTDLKEYLGRENVKGSFYLTLTDNDNKELPKDENGNFIAEAGQPYKLTLTVNSPNGFAPGSYTYQLPAGLTVQNGSGDLIADNKQLGSWSIDPNGLITLVFNQTANNYTNAILSAQMGITFEATDSIIEFDGEIKVVIKEPPGEEEVEIEMAKWGQSEDGTSITWQVRVVGHEGASIAGTLVTDMLTSDNHSYTDLNRQNTIVVNASGAGGVWHVWTVRENDPNLRYWTDTGWQYEMPATVYCEQCNQTITLVDEWTYDFYYTTTPETSDSNGTKYYTNHAEFGDYEKDGIAQIKYGTGPMGVHKTGSFQGDAEGGKFVWTVKVQLPGMSAGQKAVYNWYLTDGMNLKYANGQEVDGEIVHKPHNDMDLSVVTITRNGVTTTLNRIEAATDADEIVWDSESAGWNDEIQRIDFYCRCHCTEANCTKWQNGQCNEGHINGFCACWTISDDVEILFTYETDAKTIIEYYGENGKFITNLVELWHSGGWQHGSGAEVEIPGIFEKSLIDDFTSNDPNHPERKYIASYTITLNEAKLNLSPNGTPITIIDEMTDSLAYISGSMVITEEDLYGSTRVLSYGTDYTLSYDGSDREDNLHVLTIVLQNPQPAMYTLKYDTSIVIKADITEAIPYQNWARVTILGKNLTADTDRLIYADINYAAKSYQIDIVKTVSGTDVLLPGATFGLYNETGGLIDSQVTDENGELTFITSITDGIILLEHVPYYIQEIEAPEGFILDTTKYWFYFCDQGEGCTGGSGIKQEHKNAVRIPGDKIHTFNMENTMMGYELPATGGTGKELYTVGGTLLILAVVFLLYNQKKCRKEDIYSS